MRSSPNGCIYTGIKLQTANMFTNRLAPNGFHNKKIENNHIFTHLVQNYVPFWLYFKKMQRNFCKEFSMGFYYLWAPLIHNFRLHVYIGLPLGGATALPATSAWATQCDAFEGDTVKFKLFFCSVTDLMFRTRLH